MSNFPKLVPAFTAQIVLDAPVAIGQVSSGTINAAAPFATDGFLRSVPGYPIKVDGVFAHGSDYIRQDPSGKQARLEVNSIVKDKSGAVINYKYTGILNVTPEVGAILSGSPDAKTTEFGDAFTQILFQTGSEELKAIESKVYVGSGRFIIEAGRPPVVEYLISEVTA